MSSYARALIENDKGYHNHNNRTTKLGNQGCVITYRRQMLQTKQMISRQSRRGGFVSFCNSMVKGLQVVCAAVDARGRSVGRRRKWKREVEGGSGTLEIGELAMTEDGCRPGSFVNREFRYLGRTCSLTHSLAQSSSSHAPQ